MCIRDRIDTAMSSSGLSVNEIDVTDFTTTSFDDQLAAIDSAINTVSNTRSYLGANQNLSLIHILGLGSTAWK